MYIYIYTLWIRMLPEKVLNPLKYTPNAPSDPYCRNL